MQSIKFKPFIEIPYHRNSHKMQQHQSITEKKKQIHAQQQNAYQLL